MVCVSNEKNFSILRRAVTKSEIWHLLAEVKYRRKGNFMASRQFITWTAWRRSWMSMTSVGIKHHLAFMQVWVSWRRAQPHVPQRHAESSGAAAGAQQLAPRAAGSPGYAPTQPETWEHKHYVTGEKIPSVFTYSYHKKYLLIWRIARDLPSALPDCPRGAFTGKLLSWADEHSSSCNY